MYSAKPEPLSHTHHNFHQIRITGQPQFFAKPVATAFNSANGDVEQIGDFFCTQIHPQISAQAMIVWAGLWVPFAQPLEEIPVY